ncbi:MAG: nucleotidyl transferase AbiEii/AbiGii toxin family protein [Nitrospirae bacterium]|nr:nucleotidyl transferase AbiEii/AbiGii toxin family protein [Nitrospirota bacterium]
MDEIAENPILTREQKDLLRLFAHSPLSPLYYLSGGTALSACYLRHRLSEDLDFFTEQEVNAESVLAFLKTIPSVRQIRYERKYDRKIFLLEYSTETSLKVEFTKYPFDRIFPLETFGDVRVDGVMEILLNKLIAMTDRRDPKDYADVYAIRQTHPELRLKEAIGQAEKKFGVKGVGSILSGRFLEPPDCREVRFIIEFDPADIRRFFQDTARGIIRNAVGE